MSSSYGYYLPLHPNTFETVRFLSITPKGEGFGPDEKQKTDKNGVPIWTISALVKIPDGNQEMETFTLTAPIETANKVKMIDELAPIRLIGLAGGKWSKASTDKTAWSFQITAVEPVKAS